MGRVGETGEGCSGLGRIGARVCNVVAGELDGARVEGYEELL